MPCPDGSSQIMLSRYFQQLRKTNLSLGVLCCPRIWDWLVLSAHNFQLFWWQHWQCCRAQQNEAGIGLVCQVVYKKNQHLIPSSQRIWSSVFKRAFIFLFFNLQLGLDLVEVGSNCQFKYINGNFPAIFLFVGVFLQLQGFLLWTKRN